MSMTAVGRSVAGKVVNLAQLESELRSAGVQVTTGLGMHDGTIYTYDAAGAMADFKAADQPLIDQVVADHVALRDKNDAEYAAEFQSTSDPSRRQDIRDITAGLLPREQVPMTADDMVVTL
jgi:glutamate synthase domain-containing protein 3